MRSTADDGTRPGSSPLWWPVRALLDAVAGVLIFLGLASLVDLRLSPAGLAWFAGAVLAWRIVLGYRRRNQVPE